MKKSLIAILVAAGLSSIATAETLNIENLVSAENLKTLKENGKVELIHNKEDFDMHIAPNCEYKSQMEKDVIAKDMKQVPFVAEFLYLIPKNELLKNSDKKDVTSDDMAVVMRSISKMTGMKYTHNGNKVDTLYSAAYTIESENSKVRVADKNTGNADGQVCYCYQNDHTYGDTYYVLNYRQNSTSVYGTFLNTAPLQYLGVKAIMPKDMKISIASFDCGDCLLLYISCDCNAKSVPLFNVRKQILDSMTTRMDAIYKWFMVQF